MSDSAEMVFIRVISARLKYIRPEVRQHFDASAVFMGRV